MTDTCYFFRVAKKKKTKNKRYLLPKPNSWGGLALTLVSIRNMLATKKDCIAMGRYWSVTGISHSYSSRRLPNVSFSATLR